MEDKFSNMDFSTRGFYKVGLFNMYINGHISSDLSNMSIKDQGTFVHEYIHYIQNITTLSGLRFSSFYIDFIIRLIKWLKEQTEVIVPIEIKDVITEGSLKDNLQFFNTLSGSIDAFNFDIEQDIYWKFESFNNNELVHLNIKDDIGEQQEIIFGIHAIKESMAALYQSLIDEEAASLHYDYPYNSVIYIVKHLFPDLVGDLRRLICICQIALDSPSPARDLLKWLLYASENLEKNGIELYEIHLDEIYFTYENNENKKLQKYTVRELLNQSISKYQRKLDKILLQKNKNYAKVLNTIKPFKDIHLRILYSNDNIISNIKMVMKVCGVPFIYNDYGERIHMSNSNELDKSLIDDDILFILSLCNLCTSLILPNNNCSCRCIFRTMFCNNQLSQEELDKHIYCIDQPWREKGCNYWKILDMIDVEHSKIKLRYG